MSTKTDAVFQSARRATALVDAYKRLPLNLVSGQGAWVTDQSGRKFLDMYGGHAVASTGHCHPRLVKALSAQVGRLLFYSNMVGIEHQETAAQMLIDLLPSPLTRVFFVNSGSEAVENALKVARQATNRTQVLACEGGFHGRTLGALSATGIARYRAGAGIDVPGHAFVPFGDLPAAEAALATGAFAALILEPVQSLAGVRTADAAYFKGLRAACDAHGTLLIFDELQTGFGRTGTFAFAPRHGVVPDVMTLGKGIASGIPMGACVLGDALADLVKPGDLGTTFGGGPLACLALKITLEILQGEGLMERVASNEGDLVQGLGSLPYVQDVRGIGYLLGLKLKIKASALQAALLARGVIIGTSEDPYVARIMPPLTLSRAEIKTFLASCHDVAKEVMHESH